MSPYFAVSSPVEGKRSREEAEKLKNHRVRGTDLEIKLVAFPTLTGQLLASYLILHNILGNNNKFFYTY